MEKQHLLAKKWFKKCIWIVIGSLIGIAILVFIFDPYFHFHKPFSFVSYRLYDERYINDGITRQFDYDAIVTGTSMAQNFKPSEVDALFHTNSIKVTFSGGGYQEISQNLERALRRNPKVNTVIWTVDYNALIRDKDFVAYDNYPTYLYDDNPWNDISYIYNKHTLYHGVLTNMVWTLLGKESTTMDEYSSWDKPTGLEHILYQYDRNNVQHDLPSELTDEEAIMVYENVKSNIVDLVKQYPDITFYIFYSPYSICYWDSLKQMNTMIRQFQAEKIATELLIECSNVKLYNFFDQYDVITNTDNYRDKEHYASWINSQILKWMAADVGIVTKNNYLEKYEIQMNYYLNYDYEKIYE